MANTEFSDCLKALQKHAPVLKGKSLRELRALTQKLVTTARKLHRLAEHDCNRGLTPEEGRDERTQEERFKALCASFGCGAVFSGDPRGYAARIMFPPDPDGRRPHNTWGGEESGWGVA